MNKLKKIRVGITMGDPAGIGSEIILKALKMPKVLGLAKFVVIGDRKVFQKVGGLPDKNIEFIDLNNVGKKNFCFGKINAINGKASLEYIFEALNLWRRKQIDCLVTCPLSKEAIELAGFHYKGHTELLADLCHSKEPLMLLMNKYLKFSLVTRHIAIKKVPSTLNKEQVYKTLLSTQAALKDFFKINRPRLVVLALNPHASDGGLFGREEIEIIQPAVNEVKTEVIIEGPLAADSAIQKLRQGKYDCAVAMYHDQALIPLKLTDAGSGVNLTYGLPFVRTSPLHGTAFDIAGKNKASPNSLIAAIKLAIRCTQNQRSA
ncbi:MAG: 4-hydroxythreonine-4-phosphate dehydrogenase PdxA [Candidatus Omnitrophica bacterium]|nr:4-hydroxythreonine-4-phosphate dehydrogenase PdxA [Candidatus Omnitrophota bacterium]